MFEDLTDENFQLFAMKCYENPHCTDLLEFHDDLKRIRYIKRLFKKYRETGELKERLILNHMLILYNMFEARGMTRILFLKLEENLDYLKPFLMFLNYYPIELGLIKGKRVLDNEIPLDDGIIKILRKI
jgi:hypothetical protein